MAEDRPDEPEDLDNPPAFFPYGEPVLEGEAFTGSTTPVLCQVEAVFAAETNQSIHRYVLLSDGDRKLPIMIGQYEAAAITLPLEGHQPDRPMTHDLVRNILDKLDVKVEKIVIDDLWGNTYYAKIHMKAGKQDIVIDSRPSDAIALAVRLDAPVFVADGILEQNGN
ncbi:MAG: bifunctional nuclease family protein [Armatimonadetes bacterium]|nr:bifunctional nuclease family protein [Armatimonadota bacterium]